MLLQPPGLPGLLPRTMPHWPYAAAVDEALVGRGVAPGTVRVGRIPGGRMYIRLLWDVSRCAGPGGILLFWNEEAGWAYAHAGPGYSVPRGPVLSLPHIYATPDAVAEAAGSLVHTGRPPAVPHAEEWGQAGRIRDAIHGYRLHT